MYYYQVLHDYYYIIDTQLIASHPEKFDPDSQGRASNGIDLKKPGTHCIGDLYLYCSCGG